MSETSIPSGRSGWLHAALASRYATVVISLVVLAVLSPFLATGSLSQSALLSMLPFAAILAVASAGQTIIVQQAGVDLSVPGGISLASMLMNTVGAGQNSRIFPAMLIAIVSIVLAGVVTGLAVSWFSVTPLVATLAVNGLLLGAVLQISGGQIATRAPDAITTFSLARSFGIPNLVIVAVIVLAVVAFITTKLIYGRRFIAVGVSPRAARAAGINTTKYTVSAFALAGFCYGVAGVMLATFLGAPSIDAGNSYLLPTIAAVVVGGTALTGGKGSIIASALGALFLTQLNAVVSGIGADTSIQLIVQGAVILFALTLRGLLTYIRNSARRRQQSVAPEGAATPEPGLPEAEEAHPVIAGRPDSSDDIH